MNWKYRIGAKYVHHKNYLDKGFSLNYWVIKFGQLYVFAEVYFKLILTESKVTSLMIVIGVALYVILMWFIGFLHDKAGIYDIEHEWSNKRDPFVKQMRKKYKLKESGK